MAETRRGLSITILALILGAAGLVFGIYGIFFSPAGAPGSDGADAPGYYCTTAAEVQEAIDTIDSGVGTIYITEDITLSSQIDVDQGGDYVIQGLGGVTVDCGGNNRVFSITQYSSCILIDLLIDAANITTDSTAAVYISDFSYNPVYVQNVRIIGSGMSDGYGIYINSNNVWIENCVIEGVNYGIYMNGAKFCHANGNNINDCINGIYLAASTVENHIEQNTIQYCVRGINLTGNYRNMVSNNIIKFINASGYGISLITVYRAVIFGNLISYDNNVVDDDVIGIYLENSDYNVISSNSINNLVCTGTGTGYGMTLDVSSNENTVTGNNLNSNDVNPITDSAVNNEKFGNNPPP